MVSEPAPGPQTKDPREFLESEPAYGDRDRPEQAADEDAGLGLDSMPATDPAGGPPRTRTWESTSRPRSAT